MAQRGVIRSAAVAVAIGVPMFAVNVAPFVILGVAIRELMDQRWFTGAVVGCLCGCGVRHASDRGEAIRDLG